MTQTFCDFCGDPIQDGRCVVLLPSCFKPPAAAAAPLDACADCLTILRDFVDTKTLKTANAKPQKQTRATPEATQQY